MKSIESVTLENFQSHVLTHVSFAGGINAIIGESDKGKTAIIRGLKWVLYNEPRGDGFVRFGTDTAQVTVRFTDGYEVSRVRKKQKNYYTLTEPSGRTLSFENVSGTIPPAVLDATGIWPVRLDQDLLVKLHLAEQLEGAFLLSAMGTHRAKALGSIVRTHILDAAERDTSRDLSRLSTETKELDSQLATVEAQLQAFEGLDAEEAALARMAQRIEALIALTERLTRLRRMEIRQRELRQELTRVAAFSERLTRAEEVRDAVAFLEHKVKDLTSLHQLQRRWSKNAEDLDLTQFTLHRLQDAPSLLPRLEMLATKVEQTQRLRTRAERLRTVRVRMTETEREQAVGEKAKELTAKIERLEALQARLRAGQGFQVKLKTNLESRQKGEAFLAENEKRSAQVRAEYLAVLKQAGTCPLCGSPITGDALHHIEADLKG